MKKRILSFMLVCLLAVTILAGCGKKETKEPNVLIGTFMEKKDFMFTLLDADGVYYGFNFDVKPENYDELNNGDVVRVTYTGTISEVDPFEGEILSIEKGKK